MYAPCRNMADEGKSWRVKVIWTLLVLFGMGLAVYQISDRIGYYLHYPTTSDLNIEHNDEIRFPQLTICNENMFEKTVAEALGI